MTIVVHVIGSVRTVLVLSIVVVLSVVVALVVLIALVAELSVVAVLIAELVVSLVVLLIHEAHLPFLSAGAGLPAKSSFCQWTDLLSESSM